MRAIHRPGRTAAHSLDTARTRCRSTSAGRWAPRRSAGISFAARARRSGARPGSHHPDDLPQDAGQDGLLHAGRLPHSPFTPRVRLEHRASPARRRVYDRISGGLTFSFLRSRAQHVMVGDEKLVVASLADIIRSKQAVGRPKDRAVLPILRDTLPVKKKLEG